eukprot:762934-Hanusia_phi.AAC.1
MTPPGSAKSDMNCVFTTRTKGVGGIFYVKERGTCGYLAPATGGEGWGHKIKKEVNLPCSARIARRAARRAMEEMEEQERGDQGDKSLNMFQEGATCALTDGDNTEQTVGRANKI